MASRGVAVTSVGCRKVICIFYFLNQVDFLVPCRGAGAGGAWVAGVAAGVSVARSLLGCWLWVCTIVTCASVVAAAAACGLSCVGSMMLSAFIMLDSS